MKTKTAPQRRGSIKTASFPERPKTSGSRKRRAALPVKDYPPGYFTVPVRAWFGQSWRPALTWALTPASVSAGATRNAEAGTAFGGVLLGLDGTPAYAKPGRMGARA
jgi:hypothetical protein